MMHHAGDTPDDEEHGLGCPSPGDDCPCHVRDEVVGAAGPGKVTARRAWPLSVNHVGAHPGDERRAQHRRTLHKRDRPRPVPVGLLVPEPSEALDDDEDDAQHPGASHPHENCVHGRTPSVTSRNHVESNDSGIAASKATVPCVRTTRWSARSATSSRT